MTRAKVITPSYAPDYELCVELNRSLLDNTPPTMEHHILVPGPDVKLFRRLAGPRTVIRCDAEFLPSSFVRVPFNNVLVNLRRPFPPVRGWIMQQVLKLAAAAACEDDVVILADSDIEFVRQFTGETFVRDGVVRFYRKPGAIDARLPRHVAWHHGARSLLGLPPAEVPYADYISAMLAWQPALVRRMLARVSELAGQSWQTAIAAHLHFSEFTLYGVFVDDVVGGAAAHSYASDDPLCRTCWDTAPLDNDGARAFLREVRPTDVAAMISAKSRTPLATRRNAFAEFRARQHADEPRSVAVDQS